MSEGPVSPSQRKSKMKKLEKMIDALIEADVVWHNDRDHAISNLTSGQTWSTGIKDDEALWEEAIEIAEEHGFVAEVDDSASSIDFILHPAK